ncbi:MAG: tRNA (N(6)-L-threonylcarbamoyladenosine(37)-C(2))-methylthiotransferase MtaB [Desulfuromonadales bacterium]|jgi:threonylcarbamoyladenosine tRNA methylthiotransferase MtaB
MSQQTSPHPPSPSPRVSFATLGCKTNQFESAAMQDALQKAGYRVVSFEDGAELVIVNTCTVTSATDAQSRNLIRRARRHNAHCRVIVTGCYAQVDPAALQDLPGVSLVIGNQEKQRLLDFLVSDHPADGVAVADISQVESACLLPLAAFAGRSRAFVQIQNGCDAFCNYCIIPYARGPSRSVPVDQVVAQVNDLVEAGYQEVVLTGIHIGAYGADLASPGSLVELVTQIETGTSLHRLRLGSIEPQEVTDGLLSTMVGSKILCPHLHIPLQSGDDAVLKRMGRNYDRRFFEQRLATIRDRLPDAAICLDVITGFPGETNQEFANTRDFLEVLPLTALHVFPYSRRPGTPAAEMPDQVPATVSKARAETLRDLSATKHRHFAESFIGRDLEVVVETAEKDGMLKGVSRNYLDIRFPGDPALAGHCVWVRPTHWQDKTLYAGSVIEDPKNMRGRQ